MWPRCAKRKISPDFTSKYTSEFNRFRSFNFIITFWVFFSFFFFCFIFIVSVCVLFLVYSYCFSFVSFIFIISLLFFFTFIIPPFSFVCLLFFLFFTIFQFFVHIVHNKISFILVLLPRGKLYVYCWILYWTVRFLKSFWFPVYVRKLSK